MDLLFIALRSVVVYLFIVLAIRIFGKREITQLSIIDLVFVLLLSNAVQNAMVGPDNSLAGGIVAAIALFIVNAILGILLFKSRKLSQLLQGEDILLIYHGHKLRKHMQQVGISDDELQEAIREHGVASENDVDMAVLETDGTISILSNNFSHKTTKKRRIHKTLLQAN
jgi:uncharacterized membrane protein YcaP (DUF421 family)